jgi:hypothetical protein
VLVALWLSYFIYDTCLKDPAIKLREQEKRAKANAMANVMIGEMPLYRGDNSTESYGKKLYDYFFNNNETVKNKK